MAQRCFVIMGYGEKTDYPTGRKLDLNKTYEFLIKPAVEAAGLECIRADEIVHSQVIDVPMYELLRDADLVIADISTSNVNAFYELGVRHALRDRATIVISESKMTLPFDTSHVHTLQYVHLGPDIGASEVKTFVPKLTALVRAVTTPPPRVDSPVFTFLQAPAPAATRSGAGDATIAVLREQARQARDKSDFATAKVVLGLLREKLPADPEVAHQLALVTYKALEPKGPDAKPGPGYVDALLDARACLGPLEPMRTNNPETLGIWGAIHKRLWGQRRQTADLDAAVASYQKGFYLKNDYYNGINYAYLLNERAAVQTKRDEAIADFVLAQRARRDVLAVCEEILGKKVEDPWVAMRGKEEADVWLAATLWEAYAGLADEPRAAAWKQRLAELEPKAWMLATATNQVAALLELIARPLASS